MKKDWKPRVDGRVWDEYFRELFFTDPESVYQIEQVLGELREAANETQDYWKNTVDSVADMVKDDTHVLDDIVVDRLRDTVEILQFYRRKNKLQ